MTPSMVMSAPTSDSLAARLRQVRLDRRADQAPKAPVTWDVIRVGLTVPTVAWLTIFLTVLITQVASGAGFSSLGAATAAGWLAVNQTALSIGGVSIGVLPLLPTLLVGYGTYRVVRRATAHASSFNELLRVAGTAVIGPIVATALALAVVADGAAASPIGNPTPLAAFGLTLLVHGVAALLGLVPRLLHPFLDEFAIPASDRVGARGGAAAFGALIAGGAVAVFVGFVVHFDAVAEVIGAGNTFDGYLGLTVLSILYLPNFVVGAAAITVGASAQLGGTVIDAFSTHPGTLPPVPVAAVVPTADVGAVGGLLFLVPVVAGVLLGWFTRSHDVIAHLRAVGVGAGVASGLMVIAAGLAGGTLGEMGHAGVGVPATGVYTFAAVGVTAAATAGLYRLRDHRTERAASARPTLPAPALDTAATDNEGSGVDDDHADDRAADEDLEADPADGVEDGVDVDVDADAAGPTRE